MLVQIRTQRGIDLDEAPTWTTEETATSLRFNFDTVGDRAVDWAVSIEPRLGGGPVVVLLGVANSPAPRAPCTILTQPEPTIIRLKVALGCIDEPARVRTFARYRFDAGGNSSIDSDDRAPGAGYSPFLTIVN